MASRLIVNGELVLFGTVGMPSFFEDDDGFTAVEVQRALAEMNGNIVVKINSGGGIAFDGVAIHNALKDFAGRVTVFVQGIAASAASIIAMAGDEIVMQSGAVMMIHNGSGLTLGTKEDHQQTAGLLGKLDTQMASIYAARGAGDVEHFASLMTAETWLDGDEAVTAGLADSTIGDDASEPSAFIYELYRNAPDRLKAGHSDRLAASVYKMAASAGQKIAAELAAPQKEEKTEMDKITLEVLNADHSDLVSQISADAAKAERERIEGIDAVAFAGQETLAAELKADGKTTPEQAAVLFNKAEKETAVTRMAAVKAASDALEVDDVSTSSGDNADPVDSMPEGVEKWKAEYARDETLRTQSEKRYLAYKQAKADGRFKVLSSNKEG